MMINRRSAIIAALGVLLAPFGCQLLVGVEDRSVANDAPEIDAGIDVGVDADASDAGEADAPDDAPDADSSAQDPACFVGIERVDELSTPSTTEHSVRFTSDGLGAYLSRGPLPPNDVGEADVLYSTRPSPDAGFAPFLPAAFSKADVGDLNASETANGLSVYFDTYDHPNPCSGCRHVWRAARGKRSDPWNDAGVVIRSLVNEDFEPYALADGSAVYFVTSRGSDDFDLWRATPDTDFSMAPVDGDTLNTPSHTERAPVVTPDDRTLYFARAAPDFGVLVATRLAPGVPFGKPRSVTLSPVSAPSHNDAPVWVSDDGCDLYFRSDRAGSMDIWRARRCDCVGK